LNATVAVINIVPVSGGGSIIAFAVAVAVAINVAVSTIAVVAVILDVALSMLLRHHHHCRAPWRLIGKAGPNHATETLPMACGYCSYTLIGRAGGGGIDTRTVLDVVLSEISWSWAMEVGAKVPYGRWYLFLR
jgi:hypothetical protein